MEGLEPMVHKNIIRSPPCRLAMGAVFSRVFGLKPLAVPLVSKIRLQLTIQVEVGWGASKQAPRSESTIAPAISTVKTQDQESLTMESPGWEALSQSNERGINDLPIPTGQDSISEKFDYGVPREGGFITKQRKNHEASLRNT
ncbi:unnamed protein product [Calypogeia fissa]